MWYINLAAGVAAIVASTYLFYIVAHTAKGLKIGFLWMAVGIFIGLTLHSLAEFAESVGIVDVELLVKIMPSLVLIGSLMVLAGTVILYKTIRSAVPSKK